MSKSGQQIAKETVTAFDLWVKGMTDEDFAAINHRGKIKRSEITKAIGCGRAALRQNEKLAEGIEALEKRLRESGILARQSADTDDRVTKPFNQSGTKQREQKDHLALLEQENQQLKAKVHWLEKELARFQELSDALYELGTLTR
jgi:hypothetical protein